MPIEFIGIDDVEKYRALRLLALSESSFAFRTSHEQEKDLPLEVFASRLRASEASPNGLLGAFDDARNLVGMLGFSRESGLKRLHIGSLWSMYVVPDRRGEGFGRMLLGEALSHARKIGVRQVTLIVTVGNTGARKLYTSFGFQAFGLEKDACYEQGKFFDEEQMVLRL